MVGFILVIEVHSAAQTENSQPENFSKEFILKLDPIRKPLSEVKIDDRTTSPFEGFGSQSGLSVQGDPESSRPTSLFLRGLGSDRFVLMWNGFKLNDATTPSGSFSSDELLREFSSQKQILKGAQTLLYGSQAMGGVLAMEEGTADSQLIRLWLSEEASLAQLSKVAGTEQHRAGLAFSNFVSNGRSLLGDPIDGERDEKKLRSFTGFFEENLTSTHSLKIWWHDRTTHSDDDIFPVDDVDAYSRSAEKRGAIEGRWGGRDQDHVKLRVEKTQAERESENKDSGGETFLYDEMIREIRSAVLLSGQWRMDHLQIYSQAEWQAQDFELLNVGELVHAERLQSGALVLGGTLASGLTAWGLGARLDCQASNCQPLLHLSQELFDSEGSLTSLTLAQGLKQPTFYQLHSIYGDKDLHPETSWTAELARTGQERWGGWGANLFHTEITEMIDFDFSSSHYKNIQRALIDGLELEASRPWDHGKYKIQVTLMRAIDLSSREILPRRPQWQFAQQVTLEASQMTQWVLSARYLGERKDRGESLAEKWLWDLKFEESQNQNIFEAGVKNLMNDSSEEIAGFNSPGRRFWIGIRFHN